MYSTDTSEASEKRRCKDKLGKLNKRRLERLLRVVTTTREKIGACMAFAMERAEAADEVGF